MLNSMTALVILMMEKRIDIPEMAGKNTSFPAQSLIRRPMLSSVQGLGILPFKISQTYIHLFKKKFNFRSHTKNTLQNTILV